MPRTSLPGLARAATALAIVSIALTGCADAIREGSAGNTDQPAAIAEPGTAPHAPTQSTDTRSATITGDYQGDLATAGLELDSEIFQDVTELYEESICEAPLPARDIPGLSSLERNIETIAGSLGTNVIRVVVVYSCPARSEVVEDIIADLGY